MNWQLNFQEQCWPQQEQTVPSFGRKCEDGFVCAVCKGLNMSAVFRVKAKIEDLQSEKTQDLRHSYFNPHMIQSLSPTKLQLLSLVMFGHT